VVRELSTNLESKAEAPASRMEASFFERQARRGGEEERGFWVSSSRALDKPPLLWWLRGRHSQAVWVQPA